MKMYIWVEKNLVHASLKCYLAWFNVKPASKILHKSYPVSQARLRECLCNITLSHKVCSKKVKVHVTVMGDSL